MSFEDEFLDLMPHEVQVQHWLGEDFEGNDIFAATAQRYQCRIAGKGIALRKQFSEDTTVIFDIWLDPHPLGGGPLATFKTEDKVTLPDDVAWIDRTPVLFAVARLTDDEGHHHVKLQCGWMYHRQGQ